MRVYHYDDNGYFTYDSPAQKDVLESEVQGSDVYLTPRNSTLTAPTGRLRDRQTHRWVNNEWTIVDIEDTESDIEQNNFGVNLQTIVNGRLTARPQADIDTETNTVATGRLRETRNRLLLNTDWTQLPDVPLTDAKKTEFATYRQALRDLPSNVQDVTAPAYPTAPVYPAP